MTSIGIIIPARLASKRLPGKLLLSDTGKPLIQHTYEAAARSKLSTFIGVATDSTDILAMVRRFGGVAWKTRAAHRTGTDRIAENRKIVKSMDIVVNVQGDEPMVTGAMIDKLVFELQENPHVGMATLATPCRQVSELLSADEVKVVFDIDFRALYFSRSPIPFAWRSTFPNQCGELPPGWWRHIGVYAYRRECLLELAGAVRGRSGWRSFIEGEEGLEQLRALDLGKTIHVTLVDDAGWGVNSRADYNAFVDWWFAGEGGGGNKVRAEKRADNARKIRKR